MTEAKREKGSEWDISHQLSERGEIQKQNRPRASEYTILLCLLGLWDWDTCQRNWYHKSPDPTAFQYTPERIHPRPRNDCRVCLLDLSLQGEEGGRCSWCVLRKGTTELCVSISRVKVILHLWGHDDETQKLRANTTYSKSLLCIRSQKRGIEEHGSCLWGIRSLGTRLRWLKSVHGVYNLRYINAGWCKKIKYMSFGFRKNGFEF